MILIKEEQKYRMTPTEINFLTKSLIQEKNKLHKEYKNFVKMCNRRISLYRDSLDKRTEAYQEEIDSINRKIQELHIEELKNSLKKLILKRNKIFEERSQLENDFDDARSLGFSHQWEIMMNDYYNSIINIEEKINKLENKIRVLNEFLLL